MRGRLVRECCLVRRRILPNGIRPEIAGVSASSQYEGKSKQPFCFHDDAIFAPIRSTRYRTFGVERGSDNGWANIGKLPLLFFIHRDTTGIRAPTSTTDPKGSKPSESKQPPESNSGPSFQKFQVPSFKIK